jgi:CheY-like chemotaxis protein
LTTIIGNCEFLSELESEPEKRRLIRTIEVSGRTQLALVNDILDMSKIESGKFNIDKSAFNLNILLTDIEQMFDVKMRDKGLEFDIEQEHSFSHQIYGDGQRIGQVLINLLGNAVKFTDHGKVTLRAWSEGEELIFLVKDSGIGMPSEVVERIFQRFEQADRNTSRRFGGTGLGLYISKILVDLMGGRIEVESEEGAGSTFRVILPYVTGAPVNRRELKKQSGQADSVLNERFTGRILVAEDTPELQLLVRRILENMGLEVIAANNGEEAVEIAMQQMPDLIMMDMQMPVMDGIEATRKLREANFELPIIALTANVMQKHKDAFDAAGCNDFLEKPINKESLIAVLSSYLPHPPAD